MEPTLERKGITRGKYDHIPGWGVDADPENDPAYPMKHRTGADHEGLQYEKAPQQPVDIEVLQSIERPNITRVFGTSTPPSGLSGRIRRHAYQYSEATAKHWMTLILADRVNVIEGIIDDLKHGKVPNLFNELGWGAEWKHNRKKFVIKMGLRVAAISLLIAYMKMKKKARRYA